MIYEFIKAWKATRIPRNQIQEHDMPHYLRMLTYASQPEDNWGPAKKENRYGRYAPLESIDNHNKKMDNKPFNIDSQFDRCSRL